MFDSYQFQHNIDMVLPLQLQFANFSFAELTAENIWRNSHLCR